MSIAINQCSFCGNNNGLGRSAPSLPSMCQICQNRLISRLSPAELFGSPPQIPREASGHENEAETEAKIPELLGKDGENRQAEGGSLSDIKVFDSGYLDEKFVAESSACRPPRDDTLTDLYLADDEAEPESMGLAQPSGLINALEQHIETLEAIHDLLTLENIRLRAELRRQLHFDDRHQAGSGFPSTATYYDESTSSRVSDPLPVPQFRAASPNPSAPPNTANSSRRRSPAMSLVFPHIASSDVVASSSGAVSNSSPQPGSHGQHSQSATVSPGAPAPLSPYPPVQPILDRRPCQRGVMENLNVQGGQGDASNPGESMIARPSVDAEEKEELYEG